MQSIIEAMQTVGIIMLIIIGLTGLLPTIIAFIKRIKSRWIVLIINILLPVLFMVITSLPKIGWLILMLWVLIERTFYILKFISSYQITKISAGRKYFLLFFYAFPSCSPSPQHFLPFPSFPHISA